MLQMKSSNVSNILCSVAYQKRILLHFKCNFPFSFHSTYDMHSFIIFIYVYTEVQMS